MKRRRLLAIVGASSAALSGCTSLGSSDGQAPSNSTESSGPGGPDSGSVGTDGATEDPDPTVPEPTGECGPAAMPLSERLRAEPGPTCEANLTTRLEVGNDRQGTSAAEIEVRAGDDVAFRHSVDLEPGERSVLVPEAPIGELSDVRVSYDGDAVAGAWPGTSCRRLALAIVPEGIEAGYLSPIGGDATLHCDCYPGESFGMRLSNDGSEQRDVTITLVDHCEETEESVTVSAHPYGGQPVDLSVRAGGNYSIVASVEDGATARTAYGEGDCGQVRLSVDPAGGLSIAARQLCY